MAPKDSTALAAILTSQATLIAEVKNLNVRLFGADGQKGVIPVLFDRQESLSAHIQSVKDEALKAVQEAKDTDIKNLEEDINELKTSAKITLWKTGAISSLAGSGVGVAVTFLIKWMLGSH